MFLQYRHRLWLLIAMFAAALPAGGRGADVRDTWRDDADLHAVHFPGKKTGWAVGDHGAAFCTTDGGRNWEPRFLPADLSFRAVHFLSEKVGWAAGATTTPYTGIEAGALFQTQDAGQTWKQVNLAPLPRIHAIRFFNERDGVAAGGVSATYASGVIVTHDGGQTWQSVQAAVSNSVLNAQSVTDPKSSPVAADSRRDATGWRAAAFPNRERGAVVGEHGRRAVMGADQMLPSRAGMTSRGNLNAVVFTDDRNGWAAGDGGIILRTQDGGLVWQTPEGPLPELARDVFDFHAADAIGKTIWAAGSPGSLIWRSNDSGATWQAMPSGSPLPVHAIDFTSETEGIAVGAMGRISRTSDGGSTWVPVRAAERRAAMMTIAARASDVQFSLLASAAGDEGYRTVVHLPVSNHSTSERRNFDLRMHDAVIAAGANAAIVDWPLPIDVPGLESDQNALIAEWNRMTESRLEQVLVGRLVAAIRTWRPDVMMLSEPASDDAAGRLLVTAAQRAIDQAADPTLYVNQRPALSAWRVKKTYLRLREAEPGDDAIDRFGALGRIGLSIADVAGPAAARVGVVDTTSSSRETYRLLRTESDAPLAKPLFGGVAITPGSAARRAVGEPLDQQAATRVARRQQAIRNYANTAFDDPRQAAGLLAQIDDVSAGLTPSQAARQLFAIADAHRRQSQWDLAERTFLALVERYPTEPASRDAMTWLLHLWAGAEPTWRRIQHRGAATETVGGSIETLEDRIERAYELAAAGHPATTSEQIQQAGLAADPLARRIAPATLQVAAGVDWRDAQISHWRRQAVQIGGVMRKVDPGLFSTAEVQLPLVVAVRSLGRGSAEAAQHLGGDFFQKASNAEMIMARPGDGRLSLTTAQKTAVPPNLDGVFSDPCWQNAKEVPLVSDPSHPLPGGSLALIAFDAQFLYVAASVARVADRHVPPIEMAGRSHDADMSASDHLILLLDLDRDFATSYRFEIGERGETAESCWGDATWNPKWFASVTGDEHRWRIEAAIPLDALAARPPAAGEMWAVSFARVAPAVGIEGWPQPNDGTAGPGTFGLLRFE